MDNFLEVVFKGIGGLIRIVFWEAFFWLLEVLVSHRWLRFFFVFLAAVLWFWAASFLLERDMGEAAGAAIAAALVSVFTLSGFVKVRTQAQKRE